MLELKNLCYSVESGGEVKHIINNVSLKIDEKFVALTGPNGGGKSTLAKLIMGIIKPTSGQIIFDGQDITDLSVTERANLGIGFAFQQPVRFKGITVSDIINMASGRTLKVSEVCAYLSEVGLCAREYVNREINASLSGGELKRIEIASVMARGVKLSLFDEPEAGIDLWSFSSLIKVFEKLRDILGGSLIIISHQERILNIADRIIVIANGQIERDGTPDQVMDRILVSSACKVLDDKKGV
ncbi:MAG: ATP-binding cassette domain-containing protein [Clostridia bacterium]|nr:ATP-binding cassette domain-containing protein [Clostridia bacterium]MBQ3496088.1 ATP-binding cassette domain-containing protein [Clostridia bacterium]MBQ4587541.1 ATP-binding cassette domain-containing protein [Clostridia bacterium]